MNAKYFFILPDNCKKKNNLTKLHQMTCQISLRLKNHNNCELFESQTGLDKKNIKYQETLNSCFILA